jgi:hypothetical protein
MELFAPLGELDGDVWLSEATMVSSGVEQAVFPHPIDGECAELLVCRKQGWSQPENSVGLELLNSWVPY